MHEKKMYVRFEGAVGVVKQRSEINTVLVQHLDSNFSEWVHTSRLDYIFEPCSYTAYSFRKEAVNTAIRVMLPNVKIRVVSMGLQHKEAGVWVWWTYKSNINLSVHDFDILMEILQYGQP